MILYMHYLQVYCSDRQVTSVLRCSLLMQMGASYLIIINDMTHLFMMLIFVCQASMATRNGGLHKLDSHFNSLRVPTLEQYP